MYNEIEGTALVENVQSGYDALYGQRVTSYDAKIFASAKGPTYQANIITNYTKRPYKKGTWLQVEGRMLQATHSADFDISARELHSLAVSPPPEISPAKIWAYLAIGFRPQNLDDDLELYDPSPYPDPRQVAFGFPARYATHPSLELAGVGDLIVVRGTLAGFRRRQGATGCLVSINPDPADPPVLGPVFDDDDDDEYDDDEEDDDDVPIIVVTENVHPGNSGIRTLSPSSVDNLNWYWRAHTYSQHAGWNHHEAYHGDDDI